MTSASEKCSHVADCAALHEIANTKSGNLKALLLYHLAQGIIGVPSVVWAEFEEIYEDEANDLKPHIGRKIVMTGAHKVQAARVAEKLNSRFSSSPHNAQSDIIAAGIAINMKCILLTVTSQVSAYDNSGCKVLDLDEWAKDI